MSTDPTATAERKLTAGQAATLLGLSPQQVHDLCREGVLAHFRYGRAVRIAAAEIDRYLAVSYVPAKPEGESRDDDTAAPPRSTPSQERVA